ncbi:MAG: hypothetical protein AB1801_15450, partial [Chloroflexota bacterium]
LAGDVKDFLAKVRHDTDTHYTQTLVDAGWQAPIYPTARELHPELPALQAHSLAAAEEIPGAVSPAIILYLQHPIQVDPDPVEISEGPTWANHAPLRSDGSARQKFWLIRQALWPHFLPTARVKDHTLTVTFDPASLMTCDQATPLKLTAGAAKKPAAFRLRLNGELIAEDQLKVKQGKWSGLYRAEDGVDQTDLLLIVADPAAPFTDFPAAYLRDLLTAQVQTLCRGAALAKNLGNMLAVSPSAPAAPAQRPQVTLNTLEEARRGLREADAALRKAITSISGLESGFATMLDKAGSGVTPQPAPASTAITPEIFEAPIQEALVEIGATCQELASALNAAAAGLHSKIGTPDSFTVEQYRQGYQTAVAAAQAARQPLLKIIAQLRHQLGSAQFPLLIWRIHDQVQEIAETLRWGVLRG